MTGLGTYLIVLVSDGRRPPPTPPPKFTGHRNVGFSSQGAPLDSVFAASQIGALVRSAQLWKPPPVVGNLGNLKQSFLHQELDGHMTRAWCEHSPAGPACLRRHLRDSRVAAETKREGCLGRGSRTIGGRRLLGCCGGCPACHGPLLS